MKAIMTFLVIALAMVIPAQAAIVEVEVTGTVEYNQLRSAPLNQAQSGDPVRMVFQVDSDNFMNSPNFPVRGYEIDRSSFSLTAGPATVQMTAMDPYGRIPYFVLRNNDPVADGFFVSNGNVDFPFPGLETTQNGFCGAVEAHFDVSYGEFELDSLDILEAAGTYDYDGLTRYYFNGVDCGFEALGLIFEQFTITVQPTEVPVDVKPGSCPNPFNSKSRGVLPVAIMGTPDLDVTTIDPASIRLAGVAPLRSSYEDVGAPFVPYVGKSDCDYDCNEYEADGMMDATFKFDRQAILDALGNPAEDVCVVVQLTGNFKAEFGGLPIVGEDVVGIMVRNGGMTTIDRLGAGEAGPARPGLRNDDNTRDKKASFGLR